MKNGEVFLSTSPFSNYRRLSQTTFMKGLVLPYGLPLVIREEIREHDVHVINDFIIEKLGLEDLRDCEVVHDGKFVLVTLHVRNCELHTVPIVVRMDERGDEVGGFALIIGTTHEGVGDFYEVEFLQ